ncbi:MAG: right-handed parallel beta-helix repeat-containing protein [Candidatus Bathyarchaeota archaeon]|jgi:parallel beta-helix repeat protein
MRKAASGILPILLLTGILASAYNIQPIGADGAIYIRADGTIDPPTAPIQRDGSVYSFTDNIYDSIIVERGNIIVDGVGYTLQGSGSGNGITLWQFLSNMSIRNMSIKSFNNAIYIFHASSNKISGNIITENLNGIYLTDFASYNVITENNITANNRGIYFYVAGSGNVISQNNITGNGDGIELADFCSNSRITRNNIIGNTYGIELALNVGGCILDKNNVTGNTNTGVHVGLWCDYNIVDGNIITASNYGIWVTSSTSGNIINANNVTDNNYGIIVSDMMDNKFYHNNFIDNTQQAMAAHVSPSWNVWDDGYPSGGNFWSEYTDTDMFSGPNQDQPGSDGIWDHPYVIDAENTDRYPVCNPFSSYFDIGVTSLASSKAIVGTGYPLTINATTKNEGFHLETFNIALYANSTIIGTKEVTLAYKGSTFTVFTWDTTGFEKGNYTMSAYAVPIQGEIDTDDNTLSDGAVFVTVPGDVNGDRAVNILDIGVISSHWYPGPPVGPLGYDSNADINNDGAVDIFDVGVASAHWGDS